MKKLLLGLTIALTLTNAHGQTSHIIAAGFLHSFAVCDDSTAMAWGNNILGQLGNGTYNDSNIPVPVNSLTGVTDIVASLAWHVLALKNDSIVWAWGANSKGQLGNGNIIGSNIPVAVSSLSGITAIAAGGEHSLALKNDSTVWAWGYNFYGQLGNGTNTNSNVPVYLSSLTSVTVIAGGAYHSLALKNDSTVWTWGWNNFGQLGNGSYVDSSNIPVAVNSLTGIIAIAGGDYHSLALKSNGTVWAWGLNGNGELGNGNYTDSNVPVQVSSLLGITAIATGGEHSLALKNDGTVWAWGGNGEGQLGNGTSTMSNVPVQVNSLIDVTSIVGGSAHNIALKNDGTVWVWGWNSYGQLGNGTTINSNVPIQVTGLCQMEVAVKEIVKENSFLIYPNPFSIQTTLWADNSFHKAILTIYNSFGQTVAQIKNINGQTITLHRDNLPTGIYFIHLTQDNKVIATDKLIIAD